MKKTEKVIGIVALLAASSYALGIIIFGFVIELENKHSPLKLVSDILRQKDILYPVILVIYVFFALLLVLLSLALYEHLKSENSKLLSQFALTLAILWASLLAASAMVYLSALKHVAELFPKDPNLAASIWQTAYVVHDGLGGGNELFGALWSLLFTMMAQKNANFPKSLQMLGFLVAAAGILSILPSLSEVMTAVFGLGQLIWFAFLGIRMLNLKQNY